MRRPNPVVLTLTCLLLSAISLGAVALAWVSKERIWTLGRATEVSLPTFALCLLLAVYGVRSYGKRGLWVALAASPAFVWPAFIVFLITVCVADRSNCL